MKIVLLLTAIAVVSASAQECSENAHYRECGTACPVTCENHKNPPEFCIMMCVSGCFCDEGYVKAANGRCVKPEECPARGNPNAKTCVEKLDYGFCKGYIDMWYFDVLSGTCKRFMYSGCGGNTNRYSSEEECLENCKNVKVKQSTSEVCSLPAQSGLCDAYMPRYYFDSEIGDCKQFIYGGCGGNGNNFRTVAECQAACLADDL